MKHIKIFEPLNEGNDPSKALTSFKVEIYKKAKEEYMKLVADMLKAEGITVSKIINTDNIDDFSRDGFECSYKGKKFKIDMSNRGVSIGILKGQDAWYRAVGTGEYSTKVKTFANKIKTSIDNA